MKKLLLSLLTLSLIQISNADESNSTSELDLNYSTTCTNENTEAIVSFVGDILIHQYLYKDVAEESKHFDQIWKLTNPLFQKADFSVGNLEGPAALGIDRDGIDHGDIGFVYDGEVYSGTNFLFNYHPRIFSDLKNSGFDLLTSANNHALDRKSIGVDKTILSSRASGIPTVGTRLSYELNADFYKIVSVKNMKLAFLGCSEVMNEPDSKGQVLNCENTLEVLQNIKKLKSRPEVDGVIILTHWGVEYSHTPTKYQKEVAKRFLDAGAIAVVGSHPHVLQPWEKYVTRDGRETLIIYSLGNFVAGQGGLERKTGTVAYMGLSKNENQKAKIFGVGYTPTYRIDTHLVPIGSKDSQDVLNHTKLMYGSKARIEPDGNLRSVICQKR